MKTATVRGVDIFPPPVTWMPPNCVFEVDDVLREWTWRDPFDYIHIRILLGAFDESGWNQLYDRCYKYVTRPAGISSFIIILNFLQRPRSWWLD